MTNIERVRIAMSKFKVGSSFERAEIIEIVQSEFPNDAISSTSIIPSDYCYNLMNKDKLSNKQLCDFNIFEHEDRNSYVYLGESYLYNKEIYHRPKSGKKYVIGRWINGERHLDI